MNDPDSGEKTASAPDADTEPHRFRSEEQIGEGGMSTILRAYDRLLHRFTAQKVLKPRYHASPRHIERFTTEAQMTGQLEHPNIVPVHSLGQTDEGDWFINMKLVQGATLGSLVEEAGDARLEPQQIGQLIEILLKVCDALSFAHSRGVLHRDLKPSNIMVGAFGEVYLMDWGVAVKVDEAGGSTAGDDMTGTPAFMAPEQISGGALDPRTDVFALGATLYYCVTGRPPYPGPTAIQALSQALDCSWTPLHEALGDQAPPGIDTILQRAMRKHPEDRYPDMAALKHDLALWLRGRWRLPTRTYPSGAEVVVEGAEGDEAFIIVSGRCQAVTAGHSSGPDASEPVAPVVLGEMGPGDVFGEMAIFGQRSRTSTVVATEPLEVQVVTRKMLSAATGLDSWVGQFITALADRFVHAENELLALRRGVDADE